MFSNGKLHYKEVIGSEEYVEDSNVHAMNVFAQPMATITRRFGPVGVDAYLGFNINVYHGKVTDVGGDPDAYYAYSNGTRIGVDWTGLRAGAGLSLLIGK